MKTAGFTAVIPKVSQLLRQSSIHKTVTISNAKQGLGAVFPNLEYLVLNYLCGSAVAPPLARTFSGLGQVHKLRRVTILNSCTHDGPNHIKTLDYAVVRAGGDGAGSADESDDVMWFEDVAGTSNSDTRAERLVSWDDCMPASLLAARNLCKQCWTMCPTSARYLSGRWS